jgi:hypothetical protein
MSAFVIRQYQGMIPIANPQLLPEGTAITARNTRLTHGDLRPWNAPAFVLTPTKPGIHKTIYRFGEERDENSYWMTWTTDVDVARLPIDGDVSERTVWTGDGYPKIGDNVKITTGGTNYPMGSFRLGVPKPDASNAQAAVSGAPTNPADADINRAYVFTWVTAWGEESEPSLPVGPKSFKPGQQVNLSFLPSVPTGPYNINRMRVYATGTGDSGTSYQFHSELPIGTGSLVDTKPPEQLGEVLQTWGWEMPPEEGFGFTLGANGNAIMLKDKTIYPCIPFVFYAYPPEFQLSTESKLVGAGAFGQSFAILTESNPYILNGVDPASYAMTRIDTAQACVSKRSIVEMLGGVIYASPDGLWIVDSSGLRPLTQGMFAKEDWQKLNPSSIHAYQLEGRYYMFYDTGAKKGCMVFDFARTPATCVELDIYCTAAYNDPRRSTLYLAQSGSINKHDAGAPMEYVYRSREYRSPSDIVPGYGKVEAESYPVTFRLYANGAMRFQKSVLNNKPFRLPAVRSRSTSVEVQTSAQVNVIAIAETGEEIKAA